MLFTTTTFALVFLPVVLAGFFVAGRRSTAAAIAWLFACSLFFYGWWMPRFTLLLLGSIAMNYLIGRAIARRVPEGRARPWLIVGISANLALLGWFKYAGFLADNLDAVFGTGWHPEGIVLPIGISFYTFTQIAFLVDTARGRVNEARPLDYGLFVTWFPHLVAGPVLHHAQMMPQFGAAAIRRFDARHCATGLALFCMGLIKKVVFADGIAPYADAVYAPVDAGTVPRSDEAWLAAFAYTFQLYFDFSGYSDMAVGLSLLFNVRLPRNFDSPYRATSISAFWRRWHMTLSAFLRDYLYIALGGNRHGALRRYANLMVTMVLGGLWHGASWSFVVWGTLHGCYLLVNHAFDAVCGEVVGRRLAGNPFFGVAAWAVTMLGVVVAWVFFRATTLDGALRMLAAMASFAPASGPSPLLWEAGLATTGGLLGCLALATVAFAAPNSNRVSDAIEAWLGQDARRAPWVIGMAATLACLLVIVNDARDDVSAFIYFNF